MLARTGWWVVALLSLAYVASGLPERFSELRLFWYANWYTDAPVVSAIVRDGLANLGLTPVLYTSYTLVLDLVRAAAFYLVGALLFWRRPTQRLTLLVAYCLVALPAGDTDPGILHAMRADEPARAVIGMLVDMVAFTLVLWLCFLFPDGHFRPRWTRAVAAVWFLSGLGALFLPGSPLDTLSWPSALNIVFIPACVGVAIYAQVWRYRRVSGPVERQQAKWFALGLTILLTEFAISNVLTIFAPLSWPEASSTEVVLTDLIMFTVHDLAFLAIPLTLTIAIFRYRLWNIDILINRVLLFGSLSAMLAGIYLVGVVLLQYLFRSVTGQGSGLAVAITTLVIAALFQPLRRRLQTTIDRRFYRSKYDATRTLEAFSSRLRHQTDLETLAEELGAVVHDTMQPTTVSLWLRSNESRRS